MEMGEGVIARGKTDLTAQEDSMKGIFMRIFFGTGSDKQSFKACDKNFSLRIDENQVEKFEEMGLVISYGEWQDLCNSTRKIVSPSIGKLIFWFTFFLETGIRACAAGRKSRRRKTRA
jgi:hypothetical protein